MRKFTIMLAAVGTALFLLPGAAMAKGVSGPAIFVDGVAYRTVGTPTDFEGTGAPEHSFDTIYAFPDDLGVEGQLSVATAAPGDPGFNGGRWQVHQIVVVDFDAADSDGNGLIDSAAELEAALEAGDLIDNGIVKYFECPVIRVPAGQS